MKDLYCVILAGGRGERLWPLSSFTRPKQLIPFVNGMSLLEQTVQRVQTLARSKNYLFVVTATDLQEAVKKQVGKSAMLLTEPASRSTAAAVLLSCLEIGEKNEDAILVVLPSDHFIVDNEKFIALVKAAASYASCYDQIVLLGVKPTHPATGFGYIHYDATQPVHGFSCFPVIKFHEKPQKEAAQKYMDQGDVLWNTGIFIGRAKVFCDQCEAVAPELMTALKTYRNSQTGYEQIPAQSLDYALLEKSLSTVVFPADFAWHDVGTLPAFIQLKAQYETGESTKIINVGGQGNIACVEKKIVAFVGVSNICVVETEDSIVIALQENVDSVKDVLHTLELQEKKESKDLKELNEDKKQHDQAAL